MLLPGKCAERGLEVDHELALVQRYGSELEQRLHRQLKPTNKSGGSMKHIFGSKAVGVTFYRAIDSTGATID